MAPASGSQESRTTLSPAPRNRVRVTPGRVGRGDGENLFNTPLGRLLKEECKRDVKRAEFMVVKSVKPQETRL